ncbi:MAG: hypothetical protein A2W35_00320 [Chloroflexi bacterium RBG_16_57_11]|nr:MAG: hypothetical protein A2W35_00320 [Chloroflexi bacterium RBG_16_57_11]
MDTEEVNFIGETGRPAGFEGVEVSLTEPGSVEAVLEGVAVAGLAAATAPGRGGRSLRAGRGKG